MRSTIFIVLIFMTFCNLLSQSGQTIYGIVYDKESHLPLIGVSVSIQSDSITANGTNTDVDGNYKIGNVSLGRQNIHFTYLGYTEVIMDNIIFTSGKDVVLDVEMSEQPSLLGEVVVRSRKSGEVANEMAVVGGREFSVEETNRYAGSRGEPSRMVQSLAGVQGADDSRNDIVIRGNTPQGLIWRLEGINIPNPNHFSIPGTGGGPVSILNNKFLANSDFFTGAFPAEYSNGISGVFDLKMRNGNRENSEYSAQFGFLGTEVMAEGPLSRQKQSSYLAMYRYSTLQLFSFLGIDVGTDAIPGYQDGAFRLNFPGKKGSNLAVFGIGGTSKIGILISDDLKPDTETLIYGQNDRDQYFASDMGVAGMSFTKPVSNDAFIKLTLSASHSNVDADHNYIYRHLDGSGNYKVDSLPHILDYRFRENKYSINTFINKKLSARATIKAGLNADLYDMMFIDSARSILPAIDSTFPTQLGDWTVRWDNRDQAVLLQPYIQWKYQFGQKLTGTVGITSLYYSINQKSFSPIEPRLGLSYQASRLQKISFGVGLHSQIQSPYMYYFSNQTINRDPQEYNLDMGLTKSAQAVLAYDKLMNDDLRLKLETYYQYLFQILVETNPSSFSIINAGSGFERILPNKLINEGTGRNYGLELTLEKSFSNGYYYMFTGSVFSSKYKGSDGILRNTTFNGRYAFNALFAKEFTTRKENVLNIGAKVTYAGGRWYGPVDEVASASELEIVYEDATVNTQQFRPYFRADAKINYRLNAKKVTHEVGLDLVNILSTKNILTLTYSPDSADGNPIREEYQLGFLPLFYYKIDF
ncbi:MAG TPA: TonB-dependent receptor [Saprospiraceae bacterium]|nr:TonB-dependent receptor [Saprospiraceae bacterium]